MAKKKLKIIVIDDDEDFRKPIANILKSVGNDVVDVGGSGELYNILQKNEVDVAIVDYFLKEESGIDIVKKIKSNDKCKYTKIIMVSSHENIRPAIEKAGISDFIPKPLNPEDLIKKLKSLHSN
jgi:two-component system chemotaxis response regulator CheY